ncbi:MAG: MATE family efflux transporter [Selenomonadaceae bacterium]|nr:MATE family efflux transporter [Selenomonadaceae bacterium]
MLNGSLWDKIIIFALPLAFTGVLQQLFNAADVAVLGQFVGKNAIAAVGNNISLIGLLVNLFLGLSLGANVVIAQNIGANRLHVAHAAVSTAFIIALIVGFVITIIGELLTDPVLEYMEVPIDVWSMAETYLRIYLLGMPAIGLYNFESAIFRSRGDTKTPMIALIIASALNLALNLVFVTVFDWAVAGVAAATVIANIVSAAILFRALIHEGGIIHLDIKAMTFNKALLREIVRIGLPAGIQGMVFSISNLLIQAAINSLGADAMAASAAAFTIEINVYCFMSAFGQAATTFVSQNYGAGNLPRCKRITWVTMLINGIFFVMVAAAILIFAEPLLKFFNSDPNVIELGKLRLLYIVSPQLINVIMEIISGSLRGYGISMAPAVLTLIGVCGVRITWLYTIFPTAPNYETLMTVYPLSWLLTTIMLCFAYQFYMKHLKVMKIH